MESMAYLSLTLSFFYRSEIAESIEILEEDMAEATAAAAEYSADDVVDAIYFSSFFYRSEVA